MPKNKINSPTFFPPSNPKHLLSQNCGFQSCSRSRQTRWWASVQPHRRRQKVLRWRRRAGRRPLPVQLPPAAPPAAARTPQPAPPLLPPRPRALQFPPPPRPQPWCIQPWRRLLCTRPHRVPGTPARSLLLQGQRSQHGGLPWPLRHPCCRPPARQGRHPAAAGPALGWALALSWGERPLILSQGHEG